MADRWAVANGNWSNTATWNGGTLPGAGDDVFADNRAVTIDQDVTVLSLRTTQRSGGTAGGSFTTDTDTRIINADSYAGTTSCLTLLANSGSMQIGNSYGGSGFGSAATTVNSGCIQRGDSLGGTAALRFGTVVNVGGLQIGNSAGGGGPGTSLSGIQIGNAIGSPTSLAQGTVVNDSGMAFIHTATEGPVTEAFGVSRTSTRRGVVLIKNEVGANAKSLSAQTETDSTNVPFVNFYNDLEARFQPVSSSVNLGDFAAGATIRGTFNTWSRTTGSPFTLGGSPVLSVYKDGNATEVTTGVTLTVNFDSRTGHHLFAIATSDAFYSTGSDFRIVLTAGTVDGASVVGYEVGRFSIGNRSALTSLGANAPTNWINAAAIASNAITDVKIASNAITSAKIAANAIGASQIASDTITAAKIASNAITDAKINNGAFTAAKFAAGAFDAVWTVSTRTLSSFGTLVSDIWSAGTRTLTTVADSTGVTTLLSRIIGTLATGTHQPQSGDSFTRLGAPVGASIAADVQTRLATSGYTVPPTAAANATAVRTELTTELARIDATISSRSTFAGLGTNAPSNWINAAAIASDAITDAKIASNAITAAKIASNAITDAKINNGAFTAAKFASGAFDAVWTVATRELSAFGFSVTVGTNNDKTGYGLTQSFPTNFASLGINSSGHISRVVLVDTTTANTDMRGTDNALLASGYTAPANSDISAIKTKTDQLAFTVANQVDANALTGGGGGGLDAAGVRSAIGLASANLDTQLGALPTNTQFEARTIPAADYFDPAVDIVARVTLVDTCTANSDMRGTDNALLAANYTAPTNLSAAQVRTELATELARIDQPISSRSTFNAGSDTVTVGTNNDKTGYSLATSPPTAAQIASEILVTPANKLATDVSGRVTVGSNADKTGYALTQTFPSNFAALGINASGHISRVTLVDTTTTNTDMRGTDNALLASGYTTPPTASQNAEQVRTELATELGRIDATVSSRSTFNPSVDNTIVGTNNDKTGYGLTQAFPANFSSLGINGSGHIERVVLVDTTTANTDMRGTDNALLASGYTAPPSSAANATAVRTELATELARIDASISSRSTYAGADTAGTATLLSRLTADRAGYLDKLNVSGVLAHTDNAATFRADVGPLLTDADFDTAIASLKTYVTNASLI